MSTTRALAIAVSLAACSSKSGSSDPPAPVTPPSDASVIDGITSFGSPDPNAHVDEDPSVPRVARPANRRAGRPIEILLRSSPSGAMASVDGLQVGPTPTYWVGETGAEHEFTFSLPKHALARYRFFPVQTGTLHARLDPVATPVDVGVPPPGLVQPPLIAPPETLVAPAPIVVDAAVAPVAIDAALVPSVDAAASGLGPTP
ncbi:MAG: hypothetical protein ACKV2T_40105 [Kofleriaceae bacterium]